MISSDRGHRIPFGIVLCQSSQAFTDDSPLSLGSRLGDIAGGREGARAGLKACAGLPTAPAATCELLWENREVARAIFEGWDDSLVGSEPTRKNSGSFDEMFEPAEPALRNGEPPPAPTPRGFEPAEPALRNGEPPPLPPPKAASTPPRGVAPPAGEEGSESRMPGRGRALEDGELVPEGERAAFMSLEPPANR